MSATDEDTELRDLLVQTLDKNGVLGKIKAELRSSIFLALESQEEKTENPLKNTKLIKFVSNDDGKTCIGIIKQFLEHLNLDYTSAVFAPEVNLTDSFPETKEIANSLNLHGDAPLLHQLLQVAKSGKSPSNGPDSSQISHLRSKFHSFDHTSSGSIDKRDVATVIVLACPLMNADIIKKYVADELQLIQSQSISFDKFLNLFKKFYDMCGSVLSMGSQTKLPPLSMHSGSKKEPSENNHFSKPVSTNPDSVSPKKTDVGIKSPPKDSAGIGVPSAYLLPINTPGKESNKMDVSHDAFFDSEPGRDLAGGNLRGRPVDPMYTHIDTPAISPTSSKADNDWPSKKQSTEESPRNQQYEDDFHSEQSISEDIVDDLLHSSDKDESLDFSEDKTVSVTPRADYMEDIRHG